MNRPITVAAVDLGSNSFHMLVVRFEGGHQRVLDRLKEPVRLAGGLTQNGRLTQATQARALACLARFGQRLRQFSDAQVRVVGTNTLRQARGIGDFLERGEAALGHPIEIIYGVEEARLIYAGVADERDGHDEQRLVVDIGGGSTELVIGRGDAVLEAESVALGAVTHTARFFSTTRIDESSWKAAVTEARLALEPLAYRYRQRGWSIAIGASGSIKSILGACGQDEPGGSIRADALVRLARRACAAGSVAKLSLPGVSADRRAIFAGGLAVLTGVFDSLGITAMRVSAKALREGVINDLLDRMAAQDARDDGVADAARRFVLDREHGERVADTAVRLWQSGHPETGAGDCLDARATAEARRALRWAATLHELGLAVAHRDYHKHGEYLLAHADIRGFSQGDQQILARLVRLHRGRLRVELIDALPAAWRVRARRIVLALRLAVILHRGRDPATRPPATLAYTELGVVLSLNGDWLAARPLTRADLEREAERLARAGLMLELLPNGLAAETGDALTPASLFPIAVPANARSRY